MAMLTTMKNWSVETGEMTLRVIDWVTSLMNKNIIFKDSSCLIEFTSHDYPQIFPRRTNILQPKEYIVHLTAGQADWAKVIFQLAHELSHLAMDCFPSIHKFKWLSECLCGAASFYALSEAHVRWAKDKYFSRFIYMDEHDTQIPFYTYFPTYLNACISEEQKQTKIDEYFIETRSSLENDPYANIGAHRPRNDIFAYAFLEIIRENQRGWRAVTYMSDNGLTINSELEDYFTHWSSNCVNGSERAFVLSIQRLLGIRH